MKTIRKALPCLIAALLLGGCGGGGGGTEPAKAIPNQAPSIQLTDLTVTERASAQLTATASDSDGSVAKYAWTQVSGPQVTLAGTDTASLGFTAPDLDEDAQLVFSLTVTDDKGATSTATSTVTVKAIKHELALSGLAYDGPLPGATITLTISGRDAPLTTTADNDGNFHFSLQLDEKEDGALLSLEAKSASNAKAVLSSWLGKAQDLLAQGSSLDTQQQPRLAVTQLSTALDGLLTTKLGHAPASQAEYDQAKSQLDALHWINLAALIKAVVDKGAALPSGVTDTRDLALHVFEHQDWVDQQTSQAGFSDMVDAMLADSQVLPTQTMAPPASMTQFDKAQALNSNANWHWAADGTGQLTEVDIPTPAPFTWQAENGSWVATFSGQAMERSYDVGDSTHTQWLTKASLRPIALSNGQLLVVEESWMHWEEVSHPSGGTPQTTNGDDHFIYTSWYLTDDAVQPLAVSAPTTLGLPLPALEQSSTLVHGDQNFDYNSVLQHYSAQFQFNADGTGLRLDNQAPFQWQQGDQGLQLFWGDQSQWRFGQLRSDNNLVRVTSELGGQVMPLLVKQDWPAGTFDKTVFMAYRRDALNSPRSYYWFEFHSDGTATANWADDYDENGLTQSDYGSMPMFWTLEEGRLHMVRYRNKSTGRTCTDLQDPDCVIYNNRYLTFGGEHDGSWTVELDNSYHYSLNAEPELHSIDIRQFDVLQAPPIDVSKLPN
ncbi:hypothetical protein PVT67_18015 [Gallaecimonas kandeliae]|uniref:carboxypeptidase-like regulatory domain-containing protein n=1 Tax=Gallaecimonas kandeliae TaxID=3029055 RepID=UPI00264A41FC|nr:hypothetical protein [Gallaecimonas kandeliae]WKE65537.1 hypothetical protein PVT67_18015 [Gallaecimonas kandeliae]